MSVSKNFKIFIILTALWCQHRTSASFQVGSSLTECKSGCENDFSTCTSRSRDSDTIYCYVMFKYCTDACYDRRISRMKNKLFKCRRNSVLKATLQKVKGRCSMKSGSHRIVYFETLHACSWKKLMKFVKFIRMINTYTCFNLLSESVAFSDSPLFCPYL